jgi:hypothetical protein
MNGLLTGVAVGFLATWVTEATQATLATLSRIANYKFLNLKRKIPLFDIEKLKHFKQPGPFTHSKKKHPPGKNPTGAETVNLVTV